MCGRMHVCMCVQEQRARHLQQRQRRPDSAADEDAPHGEEDSEGAEDVARLSQPICRCIEPQA